MNNGFFKDAVYRFGDFELNSAERRLLRSGATVRLTPRAFDLLLTLVRAGGRLMTKEALLDEVWADAVVEEGNLNRTISSIRKALGEQRGQTVYIQTVPKAGYRFAAPVESVRPHTREVRSDRVSERRSRYLWLVPVGVFALLMGLLLGGHFLLPSTSVATKPQPEMLRLTNSQFEEDQAQWTADGSIRFVRFVSATRGESWIMNADGSNQRRANDQVKNLLTGDWSPDGRQVVFVKEGEGPRNVYLANADGSDERKLPLNFAPSGWSPDGRRLVYAAAVGPGDHDVFVYDIETDESTNVTKSPSFDADPVFSPDGSRIAFTSDRDGNKDAYAMNTDGSGLVRLTDHPAVDAFPVFSPDGTQVVFDSNRQGENIDIYVKNVNDDAPPHKITSLPSNEEHRAGAWSPDGTKMVITSDQGGKSNIYVIDTEVAKAQPFLSDPNAELQYPSFSSDGKMIVCQARFEDRSLGLQLLDVGTGTGATIFKTPPDAPLLALSPVFSPRSDTVLFTNRVNENTEIFSINRDGTGLIDLTNNDAADAAPSFSADGSLIFFQSNRDGAFERYHLFEMNADGSSQRRVSNRNGYEFTPRAAASGRLVFSGDRQDGMSRSLDIRILDLDDPDHEETVAQRWLHDTQPAVSPDGRRIAFVSQSDGNSEIYVVNIDGTGLFRLTRHPADDVTPAFSPDGRAIYFSSNRGGRFALYMIALDE